MNPVFHSASPACLQSCLIRGSFMKQMANWTEQLCSFHFSISCCLIKHQCSLDSTQSSVWLGRIKGALLSRKSSWQAGALRLIKLKPRVGRHRPLLAPESPGVKPCSMLLFPAPSRPSTRTWRFPRSSSSCRQTAELLMFANAWKCWVEAKIKHITYSTQSEGEAFGFEYLCCTLSLPNHKQFIKIQEIYAQWWARLEGFAHQGEHYNKISPPGVNISCSSGKSLQSQPVSPISQVKSAQVPAEMGITFFK